MQVCKSLKIDEHLVTQNIDCSDETGNEERGLPVLSFRAEGTLAGDTARARAEIDAGRAGRLTATARLPDGFGQAAPLAATLDGGLDLAPLASPFLSAGANRVAGRLAVAWPQEQGRYGEAGGMEPGTAGRRVARGTGPTRG